MKSCYGNPRNFIKNKRGTMAGVDPTDPEFWYYITGRTWEAIKSNHQQSGTQALSVPLRFTGIDRQFLEEVGISDE